jgi:putative ABC transport system permease protein
MRALVNDFRLAVRRLLRGQGFAAMAALTLALGIGANATIFALVDSTLLKPLAFRDPERLVAINEVPPERPGLSTFARFRNPSTPANILDWRDQAHSFAAISAAIEAPFNLSQPGEPREIRGALVSTNFFSLLGTNASAGRLFDAAADSGGASIAVVTQAFYRQQLGADPAAIGRTLRIDDEPYEVVGVLPASFELPGSRADVWMPLRMVRGDRINYGRYLQAYGRLAPGATIESAQAELSGVAARLADAYPDQNKSWGVRIAPLRDFLLGDARGPLLLLLGAVAILLLIVCANVANLLLGRAAGRSTEMAIRASLGASRGVLVRQLLMESLVLALVGGALGILIAAWGMDLVTAQLGQGSHLALRGGVKLGGAVVAFTAIITIVTALLFGVVPALATSGASVQGALRAGGRGLSSDRVRRRWRNTLIVAEVALALVLLAGAGLLARSFQKLLEVDPGFDARRATAMRMTLSAMQYREAPPIFHFTDALFARIAAIPGVEKVGAINSLPIAGSRSFTDFHVAGEPIPQPGQAPAAEIRIVSGDYFGAMGIPLLSGRVFTNGDDDKAPRRYVVDEALVKRCFPGQNPIGRHLVVPWGKDLDGEIVGVVKTVHHQGLSQVAEPTIYWASRQAPSARLDVVVRSRVPAKELAKPLRAAVASVDPAQPVSEIRSLEEVIGADVARPRFLLLLVGFFAGAALLLAGMGLYGVISHAVTLRTREIGIRMALGATPRSVMNLILKDGMVLTLVGLAAGLVIVLIGSRLLSGALYGVPPRDPVSLALAAAFLAGVALIASWMPARRAVRIDPMAALREE